MTTTFQYRVRDPLGKTLAGTIEALSEADATQQLRRDGFQVLELEDDDLASSGPGLFAPRISRNDVIYTTGQLAIMLDTGISLSVALAGIISEEKNPTLRGVLVEINQAVESGEDFSAALAKHPKLFDATYVALVQASEATGSLAAMLDRIALQLRKRVEARAKIRAAMAYPCVMLVLAIGVTVFLLTYVLPKFTPIFTRKGIDLPKPTVVMMTISNLLTQHWQWWLAAAVAIVGGLIYSRTTEQGRQGWDWVKVWCPVLGPLVRKATISRSVRTLGAMVDSGVSMLTALQLTGDVSGNYFYRQAWANVAHHVTSGSQIHAALSGNPLFPPMLIQMISAGEQTGKLGPVLERVSNYYDQEIDTSLKTITGMLEPILITVMGVVVGGIAMALLLPIFTLSRSPG